MSQQPSLWFCHFHRKHRGGGDSEVSAGRNTHTRTQLHVWRHQSVNDANVKPKAAQSGSVSSAEEVDGGSAVLLAFGMNRSRWLAAATGCRSCTGSELQRRASVRVHLQLA